MNFPLNPAERALTLFVYPSPHGVDWRSPYHLARSAMRNSLSFGSRVIGHVAVELSADAALSEKSANNLAQNSFYWFTGMSTKHFDRNKWLLTWEKLGLGILFYQYPGHLEDPFELIPERERRLKSGKFSFVKFLLSEESYVKVRRYLTEYQEQKKHEWYGLPNRPRYGEGAGCSAFAASFLEVAGILEEEFKKNWSGTVKAPETLIGSLEKNGRKVSFTELILKSEKNSRWALENEPGMNVFFWDPDSIHRWVVKKWEQENILDARYKKIKMNRTRGLIIDMSDRKPSDESIWL